MRCRCFEPSKTLAETKEAFLLHCALGCRIGDFQRFTMDNISVSEEGIPYVHYLPEKTKGTQKDNSEVITPLVRYAFDIIKKTEFNLPILKYPSGKSGHNKKIKQQACPLHPRRHDGQGPDQYVRRRPAPPGSGAVTHYTMLELADRFKLMNLAFDQEDYKVDKNLEIIQPNIL